MKKLIIIALAIGIFSESKAQQLPLYSQYYFNSFIYNPSQTGLEKGTSVGLVARRQFSGLSNAIGTYAATLQSRGEESKAGFGLYFYNDNTNLFRTNSITGSYAYHIDLGDEKTLSFGLGLSAIDNRFNASNFNLISENDPVVQLLGSEGGVSMDGNIGAHLDLGKFSLGIANLQILQNKTAFANNLDQKAYYNLARHWMINLGYKFEISDEWEIEPYVLYRKTQNAPGQADINLFFNWLDKGYLGLAYRDGMSFSTMVGAQVTPTIKAGYAFDLTTNGMRSALGNTHEIMLKFDLGKPQVDNSATEELLAKNGKKLKSLEKELDELKLKAAETKRDTVVIEREVSNGTTTPKESPKTPTKTTPSNSLTQYYVIAGSFANTSAGNSYVSTLKTKGLTSYVKHDITSGRYYVHMGNFTTKEGAVELINQLKPKGLSLWVKEM
jgi:type IX secretion system PorP/SprF family membrane protein